MKRLMWMCGDIWLRVGHVMLGELSEEVKVWRTVQAAALSFTALFALLLLSAAVHADELHDAAKVGDLGKVKSLLNAKIEIDVRDKSGNTPLMLAAKSGNMGVVQLLLGNGADVNAHNKYGDSVLSFAIIGNKLDVVSSVVARGGYVNHANVHGHTPLMRAAARGNIYVVNLLLDKGADLKASTKGKWPVLMSAAIGRDHKAAVEIAKLLMEKGVDPNVADDQNHTPLMAFATNGNLGGIELMLAHDVDINARNITGQTALMSAASDCQSEAVNLLLQKGAESRAIDVDSHGALFQSAAFCKEPAKAVEVAKMLFAKGVDANDEEAALMKFAIRNNTSGIDVLLEHGVKLDAQDKSGHTALMAASDSGSLDAAMLLLSKGADTSLKSSEGKTAIDYARRAPFSKEKSEQIAGRKRIAELLL